jgi:hypothetical protein
MVQLAELALGLQGDFLEEIVQFELDGFDAGDAEEKFEEATGPVPEGEAETGKEAGSGKGGSLLMTVPEADKEMAGGLCLGGFDELEDDVTAGEVTAEEFTVVDEATDIALTAEDFLIAFADEGGVVGDGEQGGEVDWFVGGGLWVTVSPGGSSEIFDQALPDPVGGKIHAVG